MATQFLPKALLSIIRKCKDEIKQSSIFTDICDEFGEDYDSIYLVPIRFDKIDTSAKTDAGIITMNIDLLKNESLDKLNSLITHELVHYYSQCDEPTQSANDGDYLDNPDELKAFQHQIEYYEDKVGKEETEEYVDQILDHHDEEGKERQRKEKNLMKRVE